MDTMTVTVRDHGAERPWGSGLTTPITRTIVISAFCPQCGGERGEPKGLNSCDDGAYYWVQTWQNPCGHVDMYTDVIKEAQYLAGVRTATLNDTVTPPALTIEDVTVAITDDSATDADSARKIMATALAAIGYEPTHELGWREQSDGIFTCEVRPLAAA